MTTSVFRDEETDHDAIQKIRRYWYLYGDEIYVPTLKRKSVVVGFGQKIIPRAGFDHKRAGIYIDFQKILVATKAGEDSRTFVSKQPVEMTNEDWRTRSIDVGRIFIRIADLPETPFWEGDVVRSIIGTEDYLQKRHIIVGIDYADEIQFSRYQTVEIGGKNQHSTSNGSRSIEMVNRGNLWKMEHGEPMEFASIEKEAEFYKSLRMSHKLSYWVSEMGSGSSRMSEPNSSDEYEFAQAIKKLKDCTADRIIMKDKSKVTFVLIKYENQEFGDRMRAHTLAKFEFAE